MVLYDVAPDDVDEFGVVVAPVTFPLVTVSCSFRPLLGRGYVLDRGVDPDIKDEVGLAVFFGVRNPPVEVAGDTPVL